MSPVSRADLSQVRRDSYTAALMMWNHPRMRDRTVPDKAMAVVRLVANTAYQSVGNLVRTSILTQLGVELAEQPPPRAQRVSSPREPRSVLAAEISAQQAQTWPSDTELALTDAQLRPLAHSVLARADGRGEPTDLLRALVEAGWRHGSRLGAADAEDVLRWHLRQALDQQRPPDPAVVAWVDERLTGAAIAAIPIARDTDITGIPKVPGQAQSRIAISQRPHPAHLAAQDAAHRPASEPTGHPAPEHVADQAHAQWQALSAVSPAARAQAVAVSAWRQGYGYFFRDAYVQTAQHIGRAAEAVGSDTGGAPLAYAIASAAARLIGNSARQPPSTPDPPEATWEAVVRATWSVDEPWRAVAEVVWQAARVHGTINGAFAAGQDITAEPPVRTAHARAEQRAVTLDGQPVEAWYRGVLLSANRGVIVPGGVPITAAGLARQDQPQAGGTDRPADMTQPDRRYRAQAPSPRGQHR